MKKKITTIEDLAVLMQNEFLAMQENMNSGFARVGERFDKIEEDIKEIRTDIEDLKLRMGEVAFHFEFRELEKRVKKLELKLVK